MPVPRVTSPGRRMIGWLRRRGRAAVVLVLVAIAVLTGAGCASTPAAHPGAAGAQQHQQQARSQQLTDVTLAGVPAEGEAGAVIAQDKGLFARAGLRVTIKTITSSAVVVPDLKSGAVQFASGQFGPFIAADVGGVADLRIIASGLSLGPGVNKIMTRAHSPVKSLADLKGKTIAVVAPNSEISDLLYSALATVHINPGQVHLVQVPFPDMAAALAAGRVDAAYMTEPYVTEAGQDKGDEGIYDFNAGSAQAFPIAGYAVLSSYAKTHPRIVRAFISAIDQGNRIADSNIGELQHAFTAGLHLPDSVADLMATGDYPDTPDPDQIQRVASLMQRYGQLKKPFSVKTMIGA